MNDTRITRAEIAQLYGKSTITVAQWHKAGKIVPVAKEGTKYFYDKAAVDRFVKQRETVNSEVYWTNGDMEGGFALTLKGWRAYGKRKSLDDVPIREIYAEYVRPVQHQKERNDLHKR